MNEAQRAFFDQNCRIEGLAEEVLGDYIPIYEKEGEVPVFLPGYACHAGGKARAKFVAEAPEGLWLGGGAVVIGIPQGRVSISDRRHGGNSGPSAQGWAKYLEGKNLMLTTLRELGEEIIVYVLSGTGDNVYQPTTEVTPVGLAPKGRVRSLNLKLDDSMVFGSVKFLTYSWNKPDRAVVCVGTWDLRALPHVDRVRIIWEDDFPENRLPGSNPRVLDWHDWLEVGSFEGLQGFLARDLKLHPVMEAIVRWESGD